MKKYKQMSEKILVEKSITGDKKALQVLVSKSKKDIEKHIKFLEPETPDLYDIMQDVMIKISKRINLLKNPDSYKSWLNRIVHNTWLDYKKSEKSEKFLIRKEIGLLSEVEEDILKKVKKQTETILQEELRDKLKGAVMRLPKEFRTVVLLRDYANLKYEDIAEILNINKGTVKSRLSRAKRLLKESLKTYL